MHWKVNMLKMSFVNGQLVHCCNIQKIRVEEVEMMMWANGLSLSVFRSWLYLGIVRVFILITYNDFTSFFFENFTEVHNDKKNERIVMSMVRSTVWVCCTVLKIHFSGCLNNENNRRKSFHVTNCSKDFEISNSKRCTNCVAFETQSYRKLLIKNTNTFCAISTCTQMKRVRLEWLWAGNCHSATRTTFIRCFLNHELIEFK